MKQKNNFISRAGARGYSPLARVLTAIVMMFTLAATGAWAQDDTKYTVAMAAEAGEGWTIAPAEATTTGVDKGTPVTLSYSGRLKVKSVTAVVKAAEPVLVTSITLNKTSTTIPEGETETLSVTNVLPAVATDKTYTWKSSDETKATVDQTGKVKAQAAGTVTIYAEANDGSGIKGECAVTVYIPPIISSYLTDGANVSVSFGDEYGNDVHVSGTYNDGNLEDIEMGDGTAEAWLQKNGDTIHAWVKNSDDNEATLNINLTNNTYTISINNNQDAGNPLTGSFSVNIGGTDVTSLLTKASN